MLYTICAVEVDIGRERETGVVSVASTHENAGFRTIFRKLQGFDFESSKAVA